MTVLVTGSTGFLGPHLINAFRPLYGGVIGTSRSDPNRSCDLTEVDKVWSMMKEIKPDIIVHTAALASVEICHNNCAEAIKTNALATRYIVRTMPKDCLLIHISTDMVYSGDRVPHREDSISVSPVNVYGMSKYMGELEAAKAPRHLIFRTNFYGLSKKSTLADVLRARFVNGTNSSLYHDAYFNPLHVRTLSDLIARASRKSRNGVFNLGSTGGMSKSRFALLMADILGIDVRAAIPIRSATFRNPQGPERPLDTRMDISKFEQSFGLVVPKMEDDMQNLKGDLWTV